MSTLPDEISFDVSGIPPTLNSSHRFYPGGVRGRIRRYPVKAFTDWMNLVSKSVKPQKISQTEWYGMNIIVYMPLYFKNGKVKRIDISNLIKYAEDAICKKVVLPDGEFDDSRIIEVTAVKQDSTELKTTIQVYTIPD